MWAIRSFEELANMVTADALWSYINAHFGWHSVVALGLVKSRILLVGCMMAR